MRHLLLLIFSAVVLAGCLQMPALQPRLDYADQITTDKNWHKIFLPTRNFKLAAYVPDTIHKDDTLSIYIEGDGLSWVTRSRPSDNPTPKNPVGLQLALNHPNGSVAYLARPCQFLATTDSSGCSQPLWTKRRFAPEVIAATNEGIDSLKQRFGAKQLRLIGYSGGGAVAVLAASKRNDVMQIITVAGNLDHKTWTDMHYVSPMTESLNPADFWQSVKNIPQVHFVGGRDQNIRPAIAESYQSRFPVGRKPIIKIIPEYDHGCCWSEEWHKLMRDLPVH